MHDPTSLSDLQEHDVYTLVTLEELDLHKTGMSEVSEMLANHEGDRPL